MLLGICSLKSNLTRDIDFSRDIGRNQKMVQMLLYGTKMSRCDILIEFCTVQVQIASKI